MSEHYSKREAGGIGCAVAAILLTAVGTATVGYIVIEAVKSIAAIMARL